jgi:hypothetical protein
MVYDDKFITEIDNILNKYPYKFSEVLAVALGYNFRKYYGKSFDTKAFIKDLEIKLDTLMTL